MGLIQHRLSGYQAGQVGGITGNVRKAGEQEWAKYILRKDVNNIVFDFEDTKFMDSSGIGIILGRYKKIALFGGKVFGVHADKQIKRILLVSGMSKIVQIME